MYMEEFGLTANSGQQEFSGVAPDVNIRVHVTCIVLSKTNKAFKYGEVKTGVPGASHFKIC